ncbi:hypothetical protein OIU84_021225 [Salix udensis]|uniref:NAD-dependent epimerase/dehydratase domain-containing protein n=1 Tax=Salix udensis TaxID=889485 RepID=A0AAD6KUK0_9ROSI|nr:hypothetical protein OIU84_021225 [Salix udensis]
MPEYCVTGGTGFIAAYLVKSLLEKGHLVRTTVRDPGDVGKVGLLREFDGAKERLKIFKADLLEEGSFDEAIQGVDGVFHTASPVLVPHDDNIQATLIDPCINGTLNVSELLTVLLILAIVKGLRGEYPNMTIGFVHIDDVVATHILAMENKKASGRLVCSSSVAHWSEIIEMLRAKYPSYPYENKCSSQKGDNNPHSMDTTKIATLGLPPFQNT